ncbi:MAG: c-type cytochrome [Rhodanobacter sp.]|jgi:cytochrome c553|nr:c-type cytochrome [Rhodanobacter sp.]
MRTLLFAVICLLAAFPAPAQTPPSAPVQPRRLGLCAACHGPTGHASLPGVPNLAGQQLAYLRDALHQYRDGSRDVPLMRAAIGPLSEAELDALARWYSVQTPQPQS